MKNPKLLFGIECLIILCLLFIIGSLINDDRRAYADEINNLDLIEVIQKEEVPSEQEKNTGELHNIQYEEEAEKTVSQNESFPMSTKEVVEKNKKTQIVVFGDSIWNAGRGSDGISEQIMEQKDVIIYNCSIGGTTAAVYNESVHWDSWTSNSFNGMMYLVNGTVSVEELIPETEAAKVFSEIDFNEVDYILIAYGLNDYFSDIPVFPKEYYDLTSYVGALRHGIQKIRENYPDIEFIIASPTYCGWFEGERQHGLGTYVEAARSVSAELNTHFLDMYHALGKNPQEKTQYLGDGVHLTKEGRYLYSRSVIDFLEKAELIKD